MAENLLDRELGGVLRLGRILEWTINALALDTGQRLKTPNMPENMDKAKNCGLSEIATSGYGIYRSGIFLNMQCRE